MLAMSNAGGRITSSSRLTWEQVFKLDPSKFHGIAQLQPFTAVVICAMHSKYVKIICTGIVIAQ